MLSTISFSNVGRYRADRSSNLHLKSILLLSRQARSKPVDRIGKVYRPSPNTKVAIRRDCTTAHPPEHSRSLESRQTRNTALSTITSAKSPKLLVPSPQSLVPSPQSPGVPLRLHSPGPIVLA